MKDDIAFQALGTVDEAQVSLGVCRSLVRERGGSADERSVNRLLNDLSRIQNDLLIAGGVLSASPGDTLPDGMPSIGEREIDTLSETFAFWRGQVHIKPRFFIAGDTRLGAEFDRTRTIVRRAERTVVRLIRERGVREQVPVSQYLNQLSDLCFVLARWADHVYA